MPNASLAELLSPQVIKFLCAMCAFPKQHRSGRVRDFIPWLGQSAKKESESFNHLLLEHCCQESWPAQPHLQRNKVSLHSLASCRPGGRKTNFSCNAGQHTLPVLRSLSTSQDKENMGLYTMACLSHTARRATGNQIST